MAGRMQNDQLPVSQIHTIPIVQHNVGSPLKKLVFLHPEVGGEIAWLPHQVVFHHLQRYGKPAGQPLLFRFVDRDRSKVFVPAYVIPMRMGRHNDNGERRQAIHNLFDIGHP